MSHFTVLVVGASSEQEVEEALHPYWELDLSQANMQSDPRSKFSVEISDSELKTEFDEFKAGCPTEKQIRYAHSKLLRTAPKLKPFDSGRPEPISKEQFENYCKARNLEPYRVEQKIGKSKYGSAKKWVQDWHNYIHSKEHGGWGYYDNPNAKWDWYQIGGRWAGYFRLKEGKTGIKGEPTLLMEPEDRKKVMTEPLTCDMAQKKDIDFEGMRLENEAEAKETWAKYQETLKENPKLAEGPGAYFDYGVRKGDTKESYLLRRTGISTFAVVKDGQWYEIGKMGWWAMVADEKDADVWEKEFRKLVDEASDDTWFAVVDCHI